jgi:hypothetical protein
MEHLSAIEESFAQLMQSIQPLAGHETVINILGLSPQTWIGNELINAYIVLLNEASCTLHLTHSLLLKSHS